MKPSLIHVLIVVLIIVIIFGAPKLPGLARSIGQSLKIFKHEVKDLRDDEPKDKQTEPGRLTDDASRAATGQAQQASTPQGDAGVTQSGVPDEDSQRGK